MKGRDVTHATRRVTGNHRTGILDVECAADEDEPRDSSHPPGAEEMGRTRGNPSASTVFSSHLYKSYPDALRAWLWGALRRRTTQSDWALLCCSTLRRSFTQHTRCAARIAPAAHSQPSALARVRRTAQCVHIAPRHTTMQHNDSTRRNTPHRSSARSWTPEPWARLCSSTRMLPIERRSDRNCSRYSLSSTNWKRAWRAAARATPASPHPRADVRG